MLSEHSTNDTINLITRHKLGETSGVMRIGYWDSIANDCSSLKAAKKSKKITRIALQCKSKSLNNMGYIYLMNGDIVNSVEYFSKALSIQEKLKDKRSVAISLNNLGYIYKQQGDHKKGLEYYKRSLAIRKELGNKKDMAKSIGNIGAVYDQMGELDTAIQYYIESLKLHKQINNKSGIALCYNNIGYSIKKKGKNGEALNYYKMSLEIDEEIANNNGILMSLNNIGKVYLDMGNLNLAEQYASRNLILAQDLGYVDDIRVASELLSAIYEAKNEGIPALNMYKLYILMRDSLNNTATQNATAKQQAKYEYEKKKALDDARHVQQIALEQEAKKKQRILTFTTAGGLGLTGVFLFFVFNRLKVTRKQKTLIEEAHSSLEEKNQEILDSISYAKRIQSAILPSSKVVKEYLKESFILYKPKDIVAGDFYWMETTGNKVLFAAADCTGHGVPGAMVSVVCNNGLNRSVREHGLTDPGEILDKTRSIVLKEFEKSEDDVSDGMDIALCSLEGNKLLYAGAHNPLWIIRNGDIIETKANKQPIGQFDHPVPYTTHSFDLESGDSLYIFSDGYVDQFGGAKGKKFKAKAFRELLLSIQDKSMVDQKTIIDEAFEAWKGDLEQIDDVCVIGVRVADN